jgi:ketopantoate reductase
MKSSVDGADGVHLMGESAMPPSVARTALRQDAALDLCRQAMRKAQAIAAATGNGRPPELAERIAANLGAKASAYKPKMNTSTSS